MEQALSSLLNLGADGHVAGVDAHAIISTASLKRWLRDLQDKQKKDHTTPTPAPPSPPALPAPAASASSEDDSLGGRVDEPAHLNEAEAAHVHKLTHADGAAHSLRPVDARHWSYELGGQMHGHAHIDLLRILNRMAKDNRVKVCYEEGVDDKRQKGELVLDGEPTRLTLRHDMVALMKAVHGNGTISVAGRALRKWLRRTKLVPRRWGSQSDANDVAPKSSAAAGEKVPKKKASAASRPPLRPPLRPPAMPAWWKD